MLSIFRRQVFTYREELCWYYLVSLRHWRLRWKSVCLLLIGVPETNLSIVAIVLEERYKGVRSPHKIKGGVSGCVRECAEAQNKDFGALI